MEEIKRIEASIKDIQDVQCYIEDNMRICDDCENLKHEKEKLEHEIMYLKSEMYDDFKNNKFSVDDEKYKLFQSKKEEYDECITKINCIEIIWKHVLELSNNFIYFKDYYWKLVNDRINFANQFDSKKLSTKMSKLKHRLNDIENQYKNNKQEYINKYVTRLIRGASNL